jgi:hydroxymethylglutaryl-CoA synthase
MNMIGITGVYPYLPRGRIKVETIDKAWNRSKTRNILAVGNYDEDIITMAVNSVSANKKDWYDTDLLVLATTSSPFMEGSAASILAYALGVKDECKTVDINQSLRSGTTGIDIASHMLESNSSDLKKALVIAADRRQGGPGSSLEKIIGDGACAVEIGTENIIGQLIASFSEHNFVFDLWQRSNEDYLQQGDDKFSAARRIENIVGVAHKILEKAELSVESIDWLVVSSQQSKLAQMVAGKLSLPKDRILNSQLASRIGFTGVSASFLSLNEVLLKAKKGDNVLLLQDGSGADGFLIKVTDEIERFQKENNLFDQIERFLTLDDYQHSLIHREISKRENLVPYSTPVYVWREKEANIRLVGQRCKKCQAVQFPHRHICTNCRSREELEPTPLERMGTIFTFTHDYVFPNEFGPVTMVVIDLDGGGRIFTQMTDYDPSYVKIGDRVRLSFRKLHEGGGYPNYFWKAVPIS